MPKAERGSVKDIANRMKAKGLQKLKFYCQVCQKQCRDANGFKCHITSEKHLRNIKLFGDNASGYLKQYSNEFEKTFLTNLKMRHGTKKVNANNVYQEVIADKEHIHMNATHWTTLTDFVQYLGKTKKCIVEENHSDGMGGWMISYIEVDASILARQEAQQRKEAADRKAEVVFLERMKTQRIEAAKALEKVTGGTSARVEATSILDQEGANPIKMGIASTAKAKKKQANILKKQAAFEDDDDDDENDDAASDEKSRLKDAQTNAERMMKEAKSRIGDIDINPPPSRKRRHRDETSHNDNKRSKSKSKTDKHRDKGWLYRNILVRVISKKLEGGKYFRKKAVVDRILDDGFAAEVEIFDVDGTRGDILRLDQSDLETVVPKSSSSRENDKPSKVRILRGEHRGESAFVEYLDKIRYRADLAVRKPKDACEILRDVPYEDFSEIV